MTMATFYARDEYPLTAREEDWKATYPAVRASLVGVESNGHGVFEMDVGG